jgi:hypothetical protein
MEGLLALLGASVNALGRRSARIGRRAAAPRMMKIKIEGMERTVVPPR